VEFLALSYPVNETEKVANIFVETGAERERAAGPEVAS
jgi:hypothetical protein